jgi:uncharacterized membrane protein YbhN (UPF0104 family)
VKGRLLDALKVAAAAAVLTLLVRRVGVDALAAALAGVRWPLLAVPLLLIAADQAVRVVAWRTLLAAHGARIGLRELAAAFAAGTFFGAVLPSSLSTDMARVATVARRPGVTLGEAASSLVVLQLFGLGAVCLFGALGAGALLAAGRDMPLTDAVLAASLAYLTLLGLLVEGRIPALGLAALPLGRRLGEKVRGWYEVLHEYASSHVLGRVAGYALLNQALIVLAHWATALALGVDVPLWVIAVATPVVTLTKMIPLSVEGFGVQQGVYVYLFGRLGVAASEALAISLLFAAVNLSASLAMGVYYAGEKLLSFGGSTPAAAPAAPARSDHQEASAWTPTPPRAPDPT